MATFEATRATAPKITKYFPQKPSPILRSKGDSVKKSVSFSKDGTVSVPKETFDRLLDYFKNIPKDSDTLQFPTKILPPLPQRKFEHIHIPSPKSHTLGTTPTHPTRSPKQSNPKTKIVILHNPELATQQTPKWHFDN